jgi:hypothetical protein
MKNCPRCNKPYEGHGALSREDNKTEICPACGTSQALAAFLAYSRTCIFEKRYCEYARQKENSFECTAPSDEAMTCRK